MFWLVWSGCGLRRCRACGRPGLLGCLVLRGRGGLRCARLGFLRRGLLVLCGSVLRVLVLRAVLGRGRLGTFLRGGASSSAGLPEVASGSSAVGGVACWDVNWTYQVLFGVGGSAFGGRRIAMSGRVRSTFAGSGTRRSPCGRHRFRPRCRTCPVPARPRRPRSRPLLDSNLGRQAERSPDNPVHSEGCAVYREGSRRTRARTPCPVNPDGALRRYIADNVPHGKARCACHGGRDDRSSDGSGQRRLAHRGVAGRPRVVRRAVRPLRRDAVPVRLAQARPGCRGGRRGETFLVAFSKRSRYDLAQRDARPWLFGIATKLVARHHRAEAARYRALRPGRWTVRWRARPTGWRRA